MSTTYQVGIEFKAKGGQALQQFTKQAETLQRTVDGTKIDALNTALGVIPGRAGAAVNGIVGLTRGLKEAQNQARATAAEIAALQAALASKKGQLGAKGGIGGESLKKEIAGIEAALAGAKGSGGAMALGLGAVAVAGVAAAAGMAAVTASAVSFTNEIDRNRQQLTLFTKDVAVTNRIIASLQRTADTTSLGLPGLLEATKTMSAYGIEARNAGAATKMLGDLALGDNEKLQRFAVNFAQISSLGKAYTVDLKQFGMAGIPIFDALSKATGKSTAEIMKMAEEGKITYPLVVKALQDLTKEGASFYNGAERGGTAMDRAVQQMQGSWEKLQQKIGTAVIPAIVGGIKSITEGLDGVVVATDAIGNAFDFINKGPVHSFVNELSYAIGLANKFVKDNPQLLSSVPGVGGALAGYGTLQGLGRKPGAGKKGDPKADEAERAKLAADAQKKAQEAAEAEKAKLAQATAEKVAKINLDTERSLTDARLGYEQQVSDFRRQQIEKIADMERQLSDERIRQEFSNIQSASRSAGLGRQISGDLAIGAAAGAGGDTRAMQAAQDTARILEESARTRREIEFNATQRKVEIERRLSDFKRETERQMGEMQIAYARQTEGILRQAGQSINDLMVKGAQQAKEILESANLTSGGGGGGGGGGATIASIADSSLNANAKAWLSVIRSAEGTAGPNGYRTMFGGGLFSDMSRHPDRVIRSGGYASAAAGAYQFMPDTWRGVGGGAMTPVRQDRAAMALARNRGVDLSTAAFTPANVAKLAGEWASLPNSRGVSAYNQPHRSFNSLKPVFDRVKGSSAVAAAATPAAAAPANNIVPTGSIPTTSPGLQAAAAGLDKAAEDGKRIQLLMEEQQRTADLAGNYKALTVEQQSALKVAQDRNKIDMATLGLIRDGVKPELASQLATNQQLVESKTQELELLRQNATALLGEKGITAETKTERQKVLDAINAQIAAQPGLLGQLNTEAQQTQAIADQRAAMDQAKSDAQGISSTITGGLKDAIKAAVTGGDVKAALSGMLASLGEKFLDMAMRPLEEMLTKSLTQMFNPQTMATTANTMALNQLTLTMQAGAFGGGGGGFGGGILGSIFGSAGSGFGGGAFGSGFNPLSTGMITPGGIFAEGGFVTGPTNALIGEGSSPEYVIPANKMEGAMSRWNAGMRGGSVVTGADPTGEAGGAAMADAPPTININGGILNFNDSQYIKADQAQSLIMQGAKMGEARTLRRLQSSAATRGKLGMR